MSLPIDLAVVLAIPVPGARPEDDLAGVPLALRTVLTLQKEGVKRALIATLPEGKGILESIRADRRVRIEVERAPEPAQLAQERQEPFLLARHDVVLDPAIYRLLANEPLNGAMAIAATREGKPIGPLLSSPELPAKLATWTEALSSLEGIAGVRLLDVGERWAERVTTPEARKRAFNAIFEACRKPMDGVVARNLNRHISIFLSKRLVHAPFTPNMLSVFTFFLGVLGAYSASLGGYWPMLIGAFLFQWNSILDGVDGELARVRFQYSKTGQWLDTVSDDASNMVFYWGLSVGSAPLPHGQLLAICGYIGIVASLLATVQYYTEMVQLGSGDLYAIDWGFDKKPPPGLPGKLIIFFRNALKKDFAILFFFGMSVFGVLPYALPIIAAAAVSTFIAATLRNMNRRRARAAKV